MALSPATATYLSGAQRIPFSAAASGGTAPLISESFELTCLESGNWNSATGQSGGPTEFITVWVLMSGAAATGTLAIFCADDNSVGSLGDGKLFWDVATLTAGALRTSHETAAGSYVAVVTFQRSGTNVCDVRPGPNKPGTFPKWYAALTSISAGTAVAIIIPGRAI